MSAHVHFSKQSNGARQQVQAGAGGQGLTLMVGGCFVRGAVSSDAPRLTKNPKNPSAKSIDGNCGVRLFYNAPNLKLTEINHESNLFIFSARLCQLPKIMFQTVRFWKWTHKGLFATFCRSHEGRTRGKRRLKPGGTTTATVNLLRLPPGFNRHHHRQRCLQCCHHHHQQQQQQQRSTTAADTAITALLPPPLPLPPSHACSTNPFSIRHRIVHAWCPHHRAHVRVGQVSVLRPHHGQTRPRQCPFLSHSVHQPPSLSCNPGSCHFYAFRMNLAQRHRLATVGP